MARNTADSALVRLLALTAAAFIADGAQALDLSFDSNAKIVQDYNTNLFLRPGPHIDNWGQGVDGGMALSLADMHWKSELTATFNNRWYVTDNNLDYYNQLFGWRTSYLIDRSRFILDAHYNNVSTLSTEADILANLGYVFRRVPSTVRSLAPSWQYSLAPDTYLNVGYNYQDTEYDKTDFNRFPDSASHSGSMDLSHQWSERLTLIGSAYYGNVALTSISSTQDVVLAAPFFGSIIGIPAVFNTPSNTSEIRTANMMLGFQYSYSDTIKFAFSGGAQYNEVVSPSYVVTAERRLPDGSTVAAPQFDRSVPSSSANTLGDVLSASLSKQFMNSDIKFEFSKSVSPNLLGQLIIYERYGVTGHHKISPQLSASLGLNYSDQTVPAGLGSASQDRQFVGVSPSLNWRWTENWTVNAAYSWRQATSPTAINDADSHAIYLNLQYVFDQQKF